MSVMLKLAKASRLSFEEWRFLLAACFWLPVADVTLRLRGLGAAKRLVGSESAGQSNLTEKAALGVDRVVYLLDAANRHHVKRFTCLVRSLVLQRLLRRKGIPSTLRIGVDLQDGSLTGHAWVECDGKPVGEIDNIEKEFLPLEKSRAVRS